MPPIIPGMFMRLIISSGLGMEGAVTALVMLPIRLRIVKARIPAMPPGTRAVYEAPKGRDALPPAPDAKAVELTPPSMLE